MQADIKADGLKMHNNKMCEHKLDMYVAIYGHS